MEKLMLAMSGGVDSSAALLLLKDKYELMGVTLRLYDNEDINVDSRTCCSLSDVDDAKAVASRFGIPHYVFNFKEQFGKQVIDRFVNSYLIGETPNPCIDCNRYIKFSELLSRAESLGCNYLATGHYARCEYDETRGRYLLKKAISEDGENNKDQSYVLYNLTQEQLSHIIFPLGSLKKTEVRRLSEENGLVNAKKPDSQDICFVPDGNYAAFIGRRTGIVPEIGDFTDTDGKKLGTHCGMINYTIGQRKGLHLAMGKPVYVVKKDIAANRVVVGEEAQLYSTALIARDLNWIAIDELTEPLAVKAKTRYKAQEMACTVHPLPEGRARVEFVEPQRAVTAGQSIVFYDGDIVVGGGIIDTAE